MFCVCSSQTVSCFTGQFGFELVILLPPKCSDYRRAPPHLTLENVLSLISHIPMNMKWISQKAHAN
jgi:hypothetical protein